MLSAEPVTDLPPVEVQRHAEDADCRMTAANPEFFSREEKLVPVNSEQTVWAWLDVATLENPTAENFRRLATEQPEQLVSLLSYDLLRPADLTFAAEAASHAPDSSIIREALLDLLEHESPLVREGAIYGLEHHVTPRIREALQEIAREDESPGVREAASEIIEN